ncbi:MAG: metal-dependent hydrolase [Akkermansiaceae bacterium]
MDSITQAALGGVVGELVLGRKLGWRGMAWGLFFGTLPDLDILVSPFLDEVTRLKWHRGISHSILLMFVGAFVFSKPLSWLHRERELSTIRAAWFVFLAWSTHVLIDVFTTYGTQILEPFSDTRVSLNNMSIIDPLFTLPLLVCVLITCARVQWNVIRWIKHRFASGHRPEELVFTGRSARIALTLSCLYALFSFGMKLRATKVFEARMIAELPKAELVQVAPSMGNTILWRGLAETDKGYWVLHWSPLDQEQGKWDFYPKYETLTEHLRDEPIYQGIDWFSRGYWVARRFPTGEIQMADMRYGAFRNLKTGRQEPMFQWVLYYDQDGNFQSMQGRPSELDAKASLKLIWRRLTGHLSQWQSIKSF